MTRFVASMLALITAVAVSAPPTRAQQSEVTAEEVVAALEAAYGVHPGQRRNHAKGTCAVGTFAGMSEAAAYSRSALFSGSPVPVVACGGIFTADDVRRCLDAGATAVQVYTALIYEGPGLLGTLTRGLAAAVPTLD